MKTTEILRRLFVLFIIMPSLVALVQMVGFWALYLSLTSPLLASYQSLISFKISILSAALGICITQVIIMWKSLNYVFGESKE